MKKYISVLLILLLLAGCKAPPAESPVPALPESPTPVAAPLPAPEPFPVGRDLSPEEIERVNAAFSGVEVSADGVYTTTAVNGFFTSYYADVRELNFPEFLAYYPVDGYLGDTPEEFAALAALPEFPWKAENFGKEKLEPMDLPVPTQRIFRASVDETLKKYAGITTSDLTDTSGTLYLPEYESYYIFTSDFGPGRFVCDGGRVTEDTAFLWSKEDADSGIRQELTLKKEGESWYIRSFLRTSVSRERSLDAFLLGLEADEIAEVRDSWGFGHLPDQETVTKLIRKGAQNSTYDWSYKDDDLVERTVWDMTLSLTDGRKLDFGAGVQEDIVKVLDQSDPGHSRYFRAPELYWTLRREYDSGSGMGTIDQDALEKYQEAVDSYLAQQVFAPEVCVNLTEFALVQENTLWNAQVWEIGSELTTDPPELAPRYVGNGTVDSKLRMQPITGEGPDNLLVTLDGKVLGYRNFSWLEAEGLGQYNTVEQLKEAMR